MRKIELMSTPQCGVRYNRLTPLCRYNISLIPVSPLPQPFSYPLFCMQLLKYVANAMQRAEGFVLERALVLVVIGVKHGFLSFRTFIAATSL